MRADVVLLPRDLKPSHLEERSVVVFDVIRATTTMTAALEAGVREIRIFGSMQEVLEAAKSVDLPERPLLCGEVQALRPPGFDLGNSPGAFTPSTCAGRTVFMATTNGTRAIVAARSAPLLVTGALVNAHAAAARVWREGLGVTLLCSGSGGEFSMEDAIGAGAVLDALQTLGSVDPASDAARMALRLFRASRDHLLEVLGETTGGRHVISVGLGADIDFAARLNVFATVGHVMDGPLRVIRESPL